MIELDGASVVVAAGSGTRTILRPTTLRLAERRVALIGANGSGKSTLARLLNGLTLPSSGRVLVDGEDTRAHGARVRSRVGFVFSDADAQLVMPTPLEDVMLSLRRLRLSRGEREGRARRTLARFGLGDLADVPVQALSGGQKQLLALAGVLATEPEVLVCDEPTTRLDLRWRRAVDELLGSLPQQVVLVTHDLEAAARFPRVLVVDDGAVVADGDGASSVTAYRGLVMSSVPAPAVPDRDVTDAVAPGSTSPADG